jgi:hypothetical protein
VLPPPRLESKFINAVRGTMDYDLDKSRGRVYSFNGDIFYSSNCRRDVRVPINHSPSYISGGHALQTNIKRDMAMDNIGEFHHPLWWSSDYTHLAFIQVDTPDNDLFENFLLLVPYINHVAWRSYMLEPCQILDWNCLQFHMRRVAKSSCTKATFPLFHPSSTLLLLVQGVTKDSGTFSP